MKYLTLILLGVFAMWPFTTNHAKAEEAAQHTAYDFSFKTLYDEAPMPLSEFKGKVLLIINTASECGFTGQYDGLEKLYEELKDKGLVVLGVPSNDFGGQEPGDNKQIASFCKMNYGVTFPMASKETVSGENAHPFYKWAKETLGFGTAPKWNFHKYLVGKDGKLKDYFHSNTTPDSDKLRQAILAALKE